MALPTAKELKALAKMCREAGIKHFKHGDIEFTLSDEAPVKPPRKNGKAVTAAAPVDPESEDSWDKLTEEEKLFWSVRGVQPAPEETKAN